MENWHRFSNWIMCWTCEEQFSHLAHYSVYIIYNETGAIIMENEVISYAPDGMSWISMNLKGKGARFMRLWLKITLQTYRKWWQFWFFYLWRFDFTCFLLINFKIQSKKIPKKIKNPNTSHNFSYSKPSKPHKINNFPFWTSINYHHAHV